MRLGTRTQSMGEYFIYRNKCSRCMSLQGLGLLASLPPFISNFYPSSKSPKMKPNYFWDKPPLGLIQTTDCPLL